MTVPTANSLRRLIYISSSREDFKTEDLDDILLHSRINNAANGISGMLLFHDGCFFQALEGQAAAVDSTFARISSDQRHSGVIVLESRNVSDRGFAQWSMGYVRSHMLRPSQREWLVDLSSRICSDNPAPLSELASINVHIEAFLSSFREFA